MLKVLLIYFEREEVHCLSPITRKIKFYQVKINFFCIFVRDNASCPNPKGFGVLAMSQSKDMELCYRLSRDSGGILLLLFSLLSKDFYNGVTTYFNRKNKKLN